MPLINDSTDATATIRSASALTEATFLRAGQTLEASAGLFADLTSRFAVVLEELEGEKPGVALLALLGMAARATALGENQARENTRFEQIHSLTDSIGGRIGQMKVSLKDVDALAVNSKIAAASIRTMSREPISPASPTKWLAICS